MELLFLALAAILVVVFTFKRIIEPAYMLIFHRPVFVHLYFFPKKLPKLQQATLHQYFSFYRNLSPQRKIYFQHRVCSFIENYNFAGRDIEVTDEMKVKIAATSVMLTFGMRKYLYDVFKAVVIYPEVYESPKDGQLHKGEFNPALGVIVFSWHDFEQGLLFDNDNLNLGLHEFAHALHFDSLSRRRPGASAVMYGDMFDEIMEYVADP
jgi:MtfA peptidase